MAKKDLTIEVQGRAITVRQIHEEEYISLTDMVRAMENGSKILEGWFRNKNTLEFLGVWERLYNPDFNSREFAGIMQEAGLNRFFISAKQWVAKTGAIGVVSKAGRYGGTYAHSDIAFEFGAFISPEFKLLLIREFKRLQTEEKRRIQQKWDYQRFLSKVNYRLHTHTIRDHIIPKLRLPKRKEFIVYADEADLLNMAIFGMTAREWREANPEQARKGNIRDHADIIQLNVMANLESLNSVLIEQGMSKQDRFEILSRTAISQYQRLADQEDMKYLGE